MEEEDRSLQETRVLSAGPKQGPELCGGPLQEGGTTEAKKGSRGRNSRKQTTKGLGGAPSSERIKIKKVFS